MPTAPIAALDKRVMTEVVNRREEGKKALTAMLFPLSHEMDLTVETVQIDEQHRNFPPTGLTSLNGSGQPFNKLTSIGTPGKPVVFGQKGNVLGELAALTDVVADADE